MRFISKVLKDSLHEKFPDATEDELLKVCIEGILFFCLNCINSNNFHLPVPLVEG